MDREAERFLTGLGARLDAAVARDEDEAATDLAFSLSQDRSLQGTVARLSEPLLQGPAGDRHEVTELGCDYVGCGRPVDLAAPLSRAVVRGRPGRSLLEVTDRRFVELLRVWVRRGSQVHVEADLAVLRGSLRRAARDHLVVEAVDGSWDVVGLAAVSSIRCVRGD